VAIAVMLVDPGGTWGTLSERFDIHIFPSAEDLSTTDVMSADDPKPDIQR
jgi:hypothetical protein